MEQSFDDDDFGELYAVDIQVPNAIPIEQEEDDEEENTDVNRDIVNLDQDDNNKTVNDECAVVSDSDSDSDSHDDDDDDDGLKIVLNDEDCPVRGVAGCADNGGDDGDKDDKSGRSRGSAFVNNMKANASMGMASYISSLNRGRRNSDTGIQNLALSSSQVYLTANPMVVQCGYGYDRSVLPWYWGIFDVNIDTLTEKPWKVPGVDITDYFNFGFNESTWKLYCASLEQLWRASLQTGISVDDYARWNKEAMREESDQVVSENVLFPSSEFGLPKGKAIQVEDSMVERIPSMDVKRPRYRDFNVIEIKLLESSDDYSGSGNSIVMDASHEGESMEGNKRNIIKFSSERDEVLSEDQLEDVKKEEDSSVQNRTGPIPGVNGDEHQDQVDQHSEDTAEVPEAEIKAEEGGGIEAFSSYPCWTESELSLGDQEHSLTSYTDSDSEATKNSVHVNDDKILSPLKRKSLNCVNDMKESSSLYCNNSKNINVNKKAVNVAYNSRTRGRFRKEWRHQSAGYEPGYNLNKHTENDNDVSSLHKSSSRDLSSLARRLVDYDRRKDQLQVFGSHKRRNVSYNRETKQSYYYDSEKVVDIVKWPSKYYHEDRESFWENTNRYDRENDVRDYFFEPGPQYADIEDREGDRYHPGCGFSGDDLSPCSYRESREFLPRHSSFPDKERDTQRKRMDEKSHYIDRNYIDDFDECEFEFLSKSYRMSISDAAREMEALDNNHEEQFPHVRDWRRSVHRGRHCDRPHLILNNLCSGTLEDDCQKNTHYRTSSFNHHRQSYTDSAKNYAYGARVCWRDKLARDNGGSNSLFDYTDAAEDEDFPIFPVEEYQFNRSPSKSLNWTEDEIICSHHETTHATSLCAEMRSDDMLLQQNHLSMPKRNSEKYFKGTSKIMCRSKGGQAVLRCRKSVELINGKGKSQVRRSRVSWNGKLENVNQQIAKKRRASAGFDESYKKASKLVTSKYEGNHENKKWLPIENLLDQGHKESSDIEEGQIVTEEPYADASVSRRDASEGAVVTDSVKKRMSQNENSSDQYIGGYDSQRILDSLAKMEKRRERFKQPITMKKEAEESMKLNSDSIVDTGEMKQHRPFRKRRWVGN